ncbi:MAG: UDP-2,3-diacylglucosamine diphosphatase, partial [Pseudoxanthomonas sp.]
DPSEVGAFVAAALRKVSDAGVPVYFIRGNRDFLVGQEYASRAGFRMLPDPAVIVLYGQPTLLMHGDLLCTDDTAYQAFRTQTRNPAWQAQFLAQPLPARLAFAAQARAASQAHQAQLREGGNDVRFETVTDVTPSTVQTTFARFGINKMIHGHTHRPALHDLRVGEQECKRIVLGDWYEQGSVLRVDANGDWLETLSPEGTSSGT